MPPKRELGVAVDVLIRSYISQSRQIFWSGVAAALIPASACACGEPDTALIESLLVKSKESRSYPEPTNYSDVRSLLSAPTTASNERFFDHQQILEIQQSRKAWLDLAFDYKHYEPDSLGETDSEVISQLLENSAPVTARPIDASPIIDQLIVAVVDRRLEDLVMDGPEFLRERALAGLYRLSSLDRIRLVSQLSMMPSDAWINDDQQKISELLTSASQALKSGQNKSAQILAARAVTSAPLDPVARQTLVLALIEGGRVDLSKQHQLTLALLESEKNNNQSDPLESVSEPSDSAIQELGARESLVVLADKVSREPVAGAATSMQNAINPGDYETRLDYLADRIFADPSNLKLNLEYFKELFASGDLEGAEVTLERVLLIDPTSRFAKILIAETQIKLGKLTSARSNLNGLLADAELPDAMRKQAEAYADQIDDALNPITWTHSIDLTSGVVTNALGRPESGLSQTIYFASPGESLTELADSAFADVAIDTTATYQLRNETPTFLSGTVFGSGRVNDHEGLSRTVTHGGAVSLKRMDGMTVYETNLTGAEARVDGKAYAQFSSLASSMMTGLTENLIVGSSLSYSKNEFKDFEGIANNRLNSGDSLQLDLSLSGRIKAVGWSVNGRFADSNADNPSVSTDLKALAMALNYQFGNCSNTFSGDRSWSKSKAADGLRSFDRKSLISTKWTYGGSCVLPDFSMGASIEPHYQFVWKDVNSNILDFAKQSNEYSVGVKVRY